MGRIVSEVIKETGLKNAMIEGSVSIEFVDGEVFMYATVVDVSEIGVACAAGNDVELLPWHRIHLVRLLS